MRLAIIQIMTKHKYGYIVVTGNIILYKIISSYQFFSMDCVDKLAINGIQSSRGLAAQAGARKASGGGRICF